MPIDGVTSGGGTHMWRHTGMCRLNGLLFHQISLDMGPSLVKKKSLEEGPISQTLRKNCKISHFGGRKTLEMGLDFRKFWKKLSIQPFFEWEKSLDMGRGFRPRGPHTPSKNDSSTPRGDIIVYQQRWGTGLLICLNEPLLCQIPLLPQNEMSQEF